MVYIRYQQENKIIKNKTHFIYYKVVIVLHIKFILMKLKTKFKTNHNLKW